MSNSYRGRPEDYTVGWICALPIELAAARRMLDEIHEDSYRNANDTNIYTLGRIGEHNVVLGCLPYGQMGTNSASAVAARMMSTFPSIEFGMMVGIGGGVPSRNCDIRLGDVVVSRPTLSHGGVVQYDFGKTTESGFRRTGFLNAPPVLLLNAIAKLEADRGQVEARFVEYFSKLNTWQELSHARGPDLLFEASYNHIDGETCTNCDQKKTIERVPRDRNFMVHYGTIASGNQVMRDAIERDRISSELGGVLCFEMEAAGLMNTFPCLVIRGICDYADSHKNKQWQAYTAGTAAAYTNVLLSVIPPAEVARLRTTKERHEMTNEDKKCLSELLLTNPEDDLRRIEDTKGGLLNDSFRWILDNLKFQQWYKNEESQLLWIKGDAGKGKTMLVIGVIKELLQQQTSTLPLLSYFLCQGTDSRLNNAVSILRGMIYLLVIQQPALVSYLRKQYDIMGRRLFEDTNAFYSLSTIFKEMLQDAQLGTVYLAVDALDECQTGLPELLRLITETTSVCSCRVKWIVSSRNRYDIEVHLRKSSTRLDLDLNAHNVSHAVNLYIDQKVSTIVPLQNDRVLQEQIRSKLRHKSGSTFLWVALVIKELQDVLAGDIHDTVDEIPGDLTALYGRMLEQINNLPKKNSSRCLMILSKVCLAYRPLHLHELFTITGLWEQTSYLADLRSLVHMCSSFLTMREDHVYFIHQSAKDYLTMNVSATIFPSGLCKVHHDIFLQSLNALSKILRRDIYDLRDPRLMTGNVAPDPDPLRPIRYSSVFLFDHLCELDSQSPEYTQELSDNGMAFEFLTKHLLHWLESLSLIREISVGILTVRRLLLSIQLTDSHQLMLFLEDAERFISRYRSIIELAPLQVYGGALIFCPEESEVKRLFWESRLPCIKNISGHQKTWDACRQVLQRDGFRDYRVRKVLFSPDGQKLVSTTKDNTTLLWDVATGALERTFLGGWDIAIAPDGQTLATLRDDTIRLWEMTSGALNYTLRGDGAHIWKLKFIWGSKLLALQPSSVKIWDMNTRGWKTPLIFQGLRYHPGPFAGGSFAPDDQTLACNLVDHIVLVDLATGAQKQIITGFSSTVWSLTFGPDSHTLAVGLNNGIVQLWDITREACRKRTFEGHCAMVRSLAFAPDSRLIASASEDCTVRLWDVTTGVCGQTFAGHRKAARSVAFSPNGLVLASGSDDCAVRLWDTTFKTSNHATDANISSVCAITFSPDGLTLASASSDHVVQLWDVATRAWKRTLERHSARVSAIRFTLDGQALISASHDRRIRFWDVKSGVCTRILDQVVYFIFTLDDQILVSTGIDFNHNGLKLLDIASGECIQAFDNHGLTTTASAITQVGRTLASAFEEDPVVIRLWDLDTGVLKFSLEGHRSYVHAITFSPDGKTLASGSGDGTVRLWNTGTGDWKQTFEPYPALSEVLAVSFSSDSRVLACFCSGWILSTPSYTVQIWDIATGTSMRIYEINSMIYELSFSAGGQYLKTDRGLLKIGSGSSDTSDLHEQAACPIFVTDGWVTCNNKNILWLPPDYRTSHCAVHNNLVALGHSSGRITWLEFSGA